MRKPNLEWTAVLVAGTFLASGALVTTVFLPLVALVQALADVGPALIPDDATSLTSRIPLLFPGQLVVTVLSLACAVLCTWGMDAGQGRRRWWILLIIISFVLLLANLGMCVITPRFMGLYRDLGIK
jgi:hypothetical protein